MIPFAKLQAAGNAYVVVDGRGFELDWPEFSRRICDPHRGVGSDGLAVVAILDQPVDDFPLASIGGAVVHHAIFPNRINFEIVNVIDRATIRVRVF